MKETRLLKTLAVQLAVNHLRNSVGSLLTVECDHRLGRPTWLRYRATQPRIVVVLGAGASFAGCGLPLASQSARQLTKKLVGNSGGKVPTKLFRDEMERLSTEYQLRKEDFETTLLALNKFNPTGLLKEMRDTFWRRFYPSLTYELLAHFAKHRMIDAIINFNFDETLDQCLDDEIGRAMAI